MTRRAMCLLSERRTAADVLPERTLPASSAGGRLRRSPRTPVARLGASPSLAGAGFTLIELLVSIAILGILAAAAVSLNHATAQRTREVELRRTLREVRTGIDRFKAEYDKAKGRAKDAREIFAVRVAGGRTGYPLSLQELVETKVLRRIPRDPTNPEGDWVILSSTDRPDATLTDRRDVFDVRSASPGVGLDGTRYDSW